MPKIETYLAYKLTDYEEAAYLLARYFIERNFDGDVVKHKTIEGAYSAVISRQGLLKNLAGSRTAMVITFAPGKVSDDNGNAVDGTVVQIESGIVKDGIIKEIFTYLLVLPAIRKFSDFIMIMNISKTKSLAICEKLKVQGKVLPASPDKTVTEGNNNTKEV